MGLVARIKSIFYQLNVLFPKAPVHTLEEVRAREREIVSIYGGDELQIIYS